MADELDAPAAYPALYDERFRTPPVREYDPSHGERALIRVKAAEIKRTWGNDQPLR